MKNLEIIVTDGGRIEMAVDGADDTFLLASRDDASVLYALQDRLRIVADLWSVGGRGSITFGEMDECGS